MENCIFCKIVRGEIPCHKIYGDDEILVFLDIKPKTKGHMLVIPKKHYKTIHDVTEDALTRIIKVAKKMSGLAKEKLNAEGINIINSNEKVAQQEIEHIHFHVVPRYDDDGLDVWHLEKKQEHDVLDAKQKLLS